VDESQNNSTIMTTEKPASNGRQQIAELLKEPFDSKNANGSSSLFESSNPKTTTSLQSSPEAKLAGRDEASDSGLESTTRAPEEDDKLYPKSKELAIIIISLCLGFFAISLDVAITPGAIPKITDAFSTIKDVGWYSATHNVLVCVAIPIYGKLFVQYSPKWTYIVVVAIFELGSVVCGTARSSSTFIFGRAIIGLGSAGVWAGYTIIIVNSVPLRRRAFYTGLVSSMYGGSAILGPLLGGLLADSAKYTWRMYEVSLNPQE
jgi:hypothetical protein